jgi:hypothetical protein
MARHLKLFRALLLSAALASSTRSTPESGVEPARPSSVSSRLARLEVPHGHLPPAGTCRVWFPGQPPGRQPKAGSCDARRAGIVVNVKVFDAASGAYLRDVRP